MESSKGRRKIILSLSPDPYTLYPLGFTDPSGYTDEENTPSVTSPETKQSQEDATPTNGTKVQQIGTKTPVAAASVNGGDSNVVGSEVIPSNIIGEGEKQKKVIAKERQEYIIERARYILKNPRNLPKAYINKLQNIVDTNKLLYEEDYMRKVKLPDGTYGFASVYGTASIRTDTIRLTKLIWQNFERKVQKGKQLSKQDLIKQIDYVIVHELQHIVRQEDEHLPARTIFESRINKWGWKERY